LIRDASERRRGIYILPNLFTTATIFLGVFAIIRASSGDFLTAAVCIVIAHISDGLDGRIARLTRTTSEFGVQYDSLADLVAFGVAPAILAYNWALGQPRSM
jgi:CDP-diacylglycerol--serine O-phosphatidyltransferase